MRRIAFHRDAWEDFTKWTAENPKLAQRLVRLITDTAKDPFSGIGKPEPLKHELKGFWSRRITDEHRLVYKVTAEEILIASCNYHYE